ncbi:hypothetical protein HDA32_004540 [Spinactinospora alkalitolerans]|uniref:Uncharacterized protein n=1 Tax=Spinactinospora alkalitolerans TaxID=687207 RepID=A0A852U685_9ACTN|nr:hypothetical protein [Spinactinospora alkalitolerans]NYE49420.1 hypothetical protein [Spinactinospora alkalitolerans]
MYGLIWRILPGPGFVKFVLSLALVAGAAALLWYVAFPWVDPYMPFNDGAVEVEGAPADGGGAPAPSEGGEEGTAESGGAPADGADGSEGLPGEGQ